ncbi:MAG: hypothetical protein ABR928_07590 [Terracidiphilus sp.]
MLIANQSSFRLSATAFLGVMLVACLLPIRAQDAASSPAPKGAYVDDWSYHHLIFSNPGTMEDAVKNGTLDKWLKITGDPRYQMQLAKRNMALRPAVAAPEQSVGAGGDAIGIRAPLRVPRWKMITPEGVKKDWSQSLGSISTTANLTVTVGSLTSTTIGSGSQITIDGVVFDASAPTPATETGTFTGNPTNGQTATVDGVPLTASVSAQATQTGTFSSVPLASSAITVVNSGNTLNLTTNATTASAIGTVSGTPTTSTSIAVTGVSNTLTLTPGGTAAHVIGTAAGTPATNTTISVTSAANTLTLSNGGTGATVVGTALGNTPTSNTTVALTSGTNTLMLKAGGTDAHVTGTTAGTPVTDTTISLTSGANTLTLSNGGTGATVVGTALGSTPTSSTTISFTSGTNTLTLKAGGTDATMVGTTAGTPAANTTISLTSGANTLTLSNGGTVGSYAEVFSGNNFSSTSGTLAITYSGGTSSNTLTLTSTSSGSNGCTSANAGTFVDNTSSSSATRAGNLTTAITNCLASYPAIGISAATNGSTVTITEALPGNFLSVPTDGLSNANGTLTAGTNGSDACTSATTGTFATSSSTATLASNINAAINACNTSYSAVGATSSYTSGSTFTVTSTEPGNVGFSGSDANSSGIFSWGTPSTPTTGSNACSSTTAGTFINSATTATLASNISAAINACDTSYSTVGATSSYSSGSTFTVTDTAVGSFPTFTASDTNSTNIFSWGSVTAGGNGSNACTSSTAGTYATSNVTTTLASNISAAINACDTSYSAVGATSSYTSGSAFTVTDTTPGNLGFSATDANSSSIFSWGTVTAGTNGSNACTSATVGTFTNSLTTATVASNIEAAIMSTSCQTTFPVGFTASYTSGSTFTVTNPIPGPFLTVNAAGNAGIFTWGGVTGGSAGTNSCASSTTGTFATSSSTTTLASNLAAAINLCPAAVGVTASSGTNTVTLTAITGGTAGNSIALTPTATGFYKWTAGDLAGGTAGTNTGASFAVDGVVGDNATNLAAAINRNATISPVITASPSGGVVTLTAVTPGTGADTLTTTESLNNFSWQSTTLGGTGATAGTNGTTSGTATPPTFAYWTGTTYDAASAVATNIATAVNANATTGAAITATANTPASGNVTLTAKTSGASGNTFSASASDFSALTGAAQFGGGAVPTVQPNAFPAKYGASLTAVSCSGDFVVYPTGQAGGTGASNIIAYDNIYATTCTGTVPSAYWAYNTGTGYAVTNSPIISMDGTQIAFMQSNGAGAQLVLLKWKAATSSTTSPAAITSVAASAYRACTAPCMVVIPLADGDDDSISAPFYDYASDDALYVGDDSGQLHQFTGVFYATPAETVSASWPVALGTNKVASPVYDPATGYLFVGDLGGVFYSVGTGNVGTTSGSIHGNTGSVGDAIADAPLVDSSNQRVYAFVTTGNSLDYTGANLVMQWDSYFTTYGSPGFVPLGTGGTGYYLYGGMFDNVYFQSTNGTGNLYVVGNTGATNGAALYRVEISGADLTGTEVTYGTLFSESGAHPYPSPLTEFCNGTCAANATETTSGTDYVFFSVNQGDVGGCTTTAGNGCILAYNVTNPAAIAIAGTGLNVTETSSPGCWATGGIVIDNDAASTGASQIYFVNLDGAGAGGPNGATSSNCTTGAATTIDAVQAKQSSP